MVLNHRLFLTGSLLVVLVLLLLGTWSVKAMTAGSGLDLPMNPPQRHYRDIPAIESDVPFITCGVCKRAVRQLINLVKATKKSKPSELDYLSVMKNLCDPLEDEGFWITEMDIVENGDALEVKRMNSPGHCEEECKTIALACKTAIDAADSEIAEILYLNKTGTTPETVCSNAALHPVRGACGTKIPPVPTNRPNRGPNFKVKTKADFEREQKVAEQLLYGGGSGGGSNSGGGSKLAKEEEL